MLPACIFILFTLIFLMMFEDKKLARSEAMPVREGEIFGVFGMIYRCVKSEHTFGWTLGSIFLLQCTIAVGQTSLTVYNSFLTVTWFWDELLVPFLWELIYIFYLTK